MSLQICYCCYALDDHVAFSCPKGHEYKICSLCASCEHTYRDCTSSTNSCINCGGSHSTLSQTCPFRRELLRRKSETQVSTTYSSATSVGAGQPSKASSFAIDQTFNSSVLKSFMCIFMAGLKNFEEPGTFKPVLDSLLAVNKLPSFEIGDVQPPDLSSLSRVVGDYCSAGFAATKPESEPASDSTGGSTGSLSVDGLSVVGLSADGVSATGGVSPDGVSAAVGVLATMGVSDTVGVSATVGVSPAARILMVCRLMVCRLL